MYSGGGGDYSNFSDFGNVVLFPKPTHVCGSNAITLNSGAIPFNVNISGYSWSGPGGFASTAANPVLNNPTAANAGTYIVTVTDENNCTYTENITVDLAIDSITVTPTPSAPCVGSTVQFTSAAFPTGAAAASILWSGPGGFTSTEANFEITGITAAQAGTYTCTYTDKYGCTVSNSTTITVSPSVVSTFTIGGEYKLSCTNPSVTLNVTGFTPGIQYETFNPYDASSLFASSNFAVITPGFYNRKPASTGVATQMNLSGLTGITGLSTAYGVKYKGFINITTAGNYTFYTNSKDGSTLSVDGSTLISNDGSHALTEVASTAVNLSAGYHSITVNYFNGSAGTAALSVSYSGPSVAKQVIPASVLFYAGGISPALTYDWSTGDLNTSSITVSAPGTYTVTGSNGGCSSVASFDVISIDSYDYSDLTGPWPVAQAKITNCLVAGVPTGANNSVWAGAGVSSEDTPLRNATASADSFDDGLLRPTVSSGPYGISLSSNTPGATVNYGLWFDWNNNGDFADDVDANGNPAFYNGSGTAGQIVSIPVLPPSGANQYKTRLIVADIPVVFTAYDDIFNNGEVEDYNSVLSLTGNVFADGNGLNGMPANTVNGTGTNAGGLTAVLVSSSGIVTANATVAANGIYNFTSIPLDTYSIVLSITPGTIGTAPPGASLAPGWVNTGENLGATAGNDGIVDGILTNIVVSTTNVTNANFGINSRPMANLVGTCWIDPEGTTLLTVPILTGSDPEDGAYTGVSNTNKITIVTLPASATLYYDGTAVTAGQVISNYNPNLLKLDPDAGIYTLSFTFNEIDAAGTESSAATVTLSTAYAGPDQGIPSNATTTLAASGTGTWSQLAGNPSVISFTSATDPSTTTSSFAVDGIYYLIWANSNGCTDTVKITVPIPAIDAVDDNFTTGPINQLNGGTTPSVLNNDSLNGTNVSLANIVLTPLTVPAGLTMNSDGTITVAANVPVGTYVVTYRICEAINPFTNCDDATATLLVEPAVIDAVVDDYTASAINGISGGTTVSVLSNDTLNGSVLTPSDITLSAVTVPAGLTLNANGTITVPAGTPAGTYVLTYRICENRNPGNCDIAEATVFVVVPSIALVKTASTGGSGAVGDVITYTFTATNTGNVTLSGVNINDALTGSTALALSPAVLAPGDSGTATASYTITQADINAGSVSNTATATGTAPDASTVSDVSGTAQTNDTPTSTTLGRTPLIALVKTASVGGTGAVGEVITYTFTATNTGNVTLSGVVIDDALTGSTALALNPPVLAPSASGTATASYTITQGDIDAGGVSNTATVTGTAPDASTVSDVSGTAQDNDTPTNTPLTKSPAIALVKTASVGGTGAVGDVISYTFTATNTGNVTLSGVNINDALTGSTALALSPAVLAPGASGTATASYTIKQSDLDAGAVSNTATVTGTAPGGGTVSDVSGTAQDNDTPTGTTLSRTPLIALVKTASVGGTGAVGDVITYTFTATNTGNVTLSGVNINDALTGSTALALSPAVLAPGASGTATA
ncbi:beta strand repeat-containing protein, partial [Pedobacter sp. AK017]|uniref:beta strand repeat-containing protein n=1 Tax=Pedobacter sp. AK017 TaxID=2723073 RepID=UPI003982FE5C